MDGGVGCGGSRGLHAGAGGHEAQPGALDSTCLLPGSPRSSPSLGPAGHGFRAFSTFSAWRDSKAAALKAHCRRTCQRQQLLQLSPQSIGSAALSRTHGGRSHDARRADIFEPDRLVGFRGRLALSRGQEEKSPFNPSSLARNTTSGLRTVRRALRGAGTATAAVRPSSAETARSVRGLGCDTLKSSDDMESSAQAPRPRGRPCLGLTQHQPV